MRALTLSRGELVWIPLVAANDKGAGHLLALHGGRALRFDAITCPDSASIEGPNTLLTGCRVRFAVGDSAVDELRLFASLPSRDGRYKFLT